MSEEKSQSQVARYLKHKAVKKVVAKVGKAKLAAAGAIGCVAFVLALAMLAALAGATSSQPGDAPGASCTTMEGTKSPPRRLTPIYDSAAEEFRLGPRGPSILAAINYVETDFGQSPLPGVRRGTTNSAGAAGPMQFLYPSSWEMYGVDGDQDGDRDVYDPIDAIFSAANLLHSEGAPQDWYEAIFSYNHADWYVQKVERIARSYGTVECTRTSGQWDLGLPGSAVAQINWANLTLSNELEMEDIKGGRLDRRIMALLALMTQDHEITITALRSDHSESTASGGVSNHFYGRAMDIGAVDGVSCTDTAPNAPCAKLGVALSQMPKPLHPTELIYCFDLDGPGPAFALPDHCDHVHAGYDG